MLVNLNIIPSFLLLNVLFQSGYSQSVDEQALLRHIRYLSSDELAGRKPLTEGSMKARAYILEHLTTLELVEPLYPDYLQTFTFTHRQKEYRDAANIVAFIPGSQSSKTIVITAHYDHVGIGKPDAAGDSIYNGADDNASGTAALLELARYFSRNRPAHGMIFAAVDAEEMGLRGAKALVEDFPYALDQIVLNINMDMISRNDDNELYASGTYFYPHFIPILESASAGSPIKLRLCHDIPGTGADDWTTSSDHVAFYAKKFHHIYFGV